MIIPQVLHIFTPYSPWHILQQLKYSETSTVYIFLTSLFASCFCTVCPVHVVIRIKLKMWMGEDSACQYESCIHSKHNKTVWCLSHNINYNCLYLLYYTYKKTLQTIKSLADCALGHNANNTHNLCIIGIHKVFSLGFPIILHFLAFWFSISCFFHVSVKIPLLPHCLLPGLRVPPLGRVLLLQEIFSCFL